MIKKMHACEDTVEYITPAAMAELEMRAAGYGATVGTLMENAGRGVAELVLSRYGPGKRVTVVCGSGNNGGDGFVAARYLSERCETSVVLLASPGRIRTAEARENWARLSTTTVHVAVSEDAAALRGGEAGRLIAGADVLIVAMLGTGIRGEVREPLRSAIAMVNASAAAKVAVDVPAGLDPETGRCDSRITVRADITAAMHLPKVGLRGREEYTGEVVAIPIGIRDGTTGAG